MPTVTKLTVSVISVASGSFRFLFEVYGDHRDLHVLTHSFPTRRSSDLGEAARAIGAEAVAAIAVEHRLGEDRSGGIARAQEQHVVGRIGSFQQQSASSATSGAHRSARPPQQ